jgi:hypothetical protein
MSRRASLQTGSHFCDNISQKKDVVIRTDEGIAVSGFIVPRVLDNLKEGSVDLARRSGHRAAAAFAEGAPPSAEAYRRQRCQVLTRRSARSPTTTQLPQSRYIALAMGAVAEGLRDT